MIVYLIRHKESGKCYVGQTVSSFAQRMAQHRYQAFTEGRYKTAIASAIKHYGWGEFETSILEVCDSKDGMDAAEIAWIEKLNALAPNGYNLQIGGPSLPRAPRRPRPKRNFSTETRQKMFQARADKSHLNWDHVREIRRRWNSNERVGVLAGDFGVTHGAIGQIIRNVVWVDPEYMPTRSIVTRRRSHTT